MHRERTVDSGYYGNGAERCPNTHRNQQPYGQHEERAPEFASADQPNDAVHKMFDRFSLPEYGAVTGGDQHDEGDQPHYLQSAEKAVVKVFEFQHSGGDHDDKRDKGSQRHRTGP